LLVWFKRLFPLSHVYIFIASLYLAQMIYPLSYQKIAGVFEPFKAHIVDWGNVIISLLTALFLVGVIILVAKIILTLVLHLPFLSLDDDERKGIVSLIPNPVKLTFCIGWVIAILLFFNYLNITDPISYWVNFYQTTAQQVLMNEITRRISTGLFWLVLIWLIVLFLSEIFNHRKKIYTFIQTLYTKLKKTRN
jgi:hypothetical protein